MKTFMPVENGKTLEAVRGVLRKLLESDLVEALMVPMRTPAGTVTPALVTDPALLDQADPLAPVFPANSARLLGWMTQREPRGRIGAVMRSCEMRAMVELVKLKQACLDCVTLISVDCAGTFGIGELGNQEIGGLWRDMFNNPIPKSTNPQIPELRDGCQMCEKPTYDAADIVFEFLGNDLAQGFHLDLPDEMAEKLGLTEAAEGDNRNIPAAAGDRAEVVEKLVAQRTQRRDEVFADIRGQLDEGGVETVFAACIRCHNCMTVCPICYCKTCLFKGPVFDHEPIQYLQWAQNKGALRLPSDTGLFHLTRMNHIALSCIGCGMCTSACPADLPVGRVFRAVGDSVQAAFEYTPGRDPEEPLPLITFEENEWLEVTE